MLISFSVKNYKSFSEKQEFSMVAGRGTKDTETISFPSGNTMAPHLLRASGIFGSNGSGKSSLLEAMNFCSKFIFKSAKDLQEGESIKTKPHLFDEKYATAPSEFEFVFIHEKTLYQYGFSVDEERVHEEWMFTKSNDTGSRTRHVYHREYKGNKEYDWYLNDSLLKGDKNTWKNATRPNALFLSQAVQLNSEQLKIPFNWFYKKLKFIDRADSKLSPQYTAHKWKKSENQKQILDILQSVDVRIVDLGIENKEITHADLPSNMPEELKESILNSKKLEIYSTHKTKDKKSVKLNFREESTGTQNIFSLAGPWLDVLENGYTLMVDELHSSLHPHALNMLVAMFHNPKINKNNAQIIFTGHDTSVLTYDFMHQEQFWITEKTQHENTQLIPLSDFDIKKSNNMQKSYLNGRYGGVPIIKEFL